MHHYKYHLFCKVEVRDQKSVLTLQKKLNSIPQEDATAGEILATMMSNERWIEEVIEPNTLFTRIVFYRVEKVVARC